MSSNLTIPRPDMKGDSPALQALFSAYDFAQAVEAGEQPNAAQIAALLALLREGIEDVHPTSGGPVEWDPIALGY